MVIGYFLSGEVHAADNLFTDNIGIGTTNPTASVHLGAGLLKFSDGSTQSTAFTGSGTGGWTDVAGNVYLTTSTDSVGLGTTTPTAKLHLLSANRQIRLSYDASNYADLVTLSDGMFSIGSNGTTNFKFGSHPTSGYSAIWPGGVTPAAGNYVMKTKNDGTETWFNAASGGYLAFTLNNASTLPLAVIGSNVGVGFASPPVIPNLFSVNGAAGFVGNVGIGITGASSARLDVVTAGTSTGFGVRVRDNAGTDRVVILDNGNVGIGTTNPVYTLQVNGTLDADEITENGLAIGSSGWTDDGPVVRLTTSEDSVGIGGTSPAKLYIKGAGTNTGFSLRTADANSADKFVVLDNGNVGINTTAPVYNLQVNGTLDADTVNQGGFPVGTGGWTDNASDVFLSTSADNVGIGTPYPMRRLHINGGAIYLASNVPSPTTNCLYNDSGTLKWNGSALSTGSSVSGAAGWIGKFTASDAVGGSMYIYENDAGNVGIGITDTGKLTVAGGIIAGNGFNVNIPNSAGGNWITNADFALWTADHTGGIGDEAYIARYIRSGEATTLEIANKNGAFDHIALMPSGNVGIGTTNPIYKLHVNGTLDATQITVNGLPLNTDDWTDGTDNVYLNRSADNVGIGTSTPGSAKLYLQGAGTGPGFTLRVQNASSADKAVILDSGNVGIGTTLPNNLLTVGDYNTAYTSSQKQGLLSVDNTLLSNLEGGAYFGRVGVKESQWQVVDADYLPGSYRVLNSTKRNYAGIAISSDARIQTAVVYGSTNDQGIWRSTDYGATWNQVDSTARNYRDIAMSSDGKIQTAVVESGFIYVSTDYGNSGSWSQKGSSLGYYGVAISSDGKIQTAVVAGGKIYVSKDYGVNWVEEDSTSRTYHCVAMSSDGKIQTAGVYGTTAGQGLYVSRDYGDSWVQKQSLAGYWEGVAMSADGRIQTAVLYQDLYGGYNGIFVSRDYGETWFWESSSASKRYSIAMSSDGKIQITGTNLTGELSTDYGNTWTGLTSYGDYVALPSDGRIKIGVEDEATGKITILVTSLHTSGNVGIGKTSPTAPLDIRGAGTSTAYTLRVQDSAGTDRLVILDNGNVGIGTANPAYKLKVNGTLDADDITENGNQVGVGGAWTNSGQDVYLSTSADNVGIGTSTPGSAKLYIQGAGANSGFTLRTKDSSGADKVVFLDNGNVGVGAAAPNARLEVAGAIETAYSTKTASDTINGSHNVVVGNPASANITFTLPTAAGITGVKYTFKNISATYDVIIDGAGSETIDGGATKTLDTNAALIVISDGANWIIASTVGTVT